MDVVAEFETRARADGSSEQRIGLEPLEKPSCSVLAALNEARFTGAQMRAAVDAIKHVQIRAPGDIAEHARLLRAFLRAQDLGSSEFAVAGLHGRIMAMDRWCARHDRDGQSDVDAFFEAAGRQPLISTHDGIGFEPGTFRELIEFIREMPY
jgi:hypothetical protein